MKEKRAPTKRNLTSKVLVLFTIIVALESGFLLFLSLLLDDSERRLAEERYARSVVAAIGKFSSTQQYSAMALVNQTRFKTIMLDEYKEIFSRLPRDLDELRTLFKNRPADLERLKELDNLVNDAMELIEKVIATNRDKDTAQKKMLHHHYCIQLIDLSEAISRQVDEMSVKYREIEANASISAAALSDNLLYLCVGLGFLVNAGVAIALYMFVVRGITDRLNVVAENTVNIALGKPLLEPVKGDDEVAELDATFREMEKHLKEIQTKEKTILEHAANFICLLDKKGFFVSVPAVCSAMWGFQEGDLIGSKFNSIVTNEYLECTNTALGSLQSSGGSANFENQIRCQDGSLMDLSWTATINSEGNVICVAHDITERKRITRLIQASEQRFSKIVESMPIAVICCDRSFIVESLNSPTTAMFHYQVNELLGRSLDVLLSSPSLIRPAKQSEELKEVMDLALKETTQLNAWCRDGKQLPVELRLNAYAAPQGERLLACFRDISARVELDLAKRDFVSMISHDLRSPLMSLYGTLGMMASAHGSDSVFASTEKIVDNLVVLINDFLELGKMEAASDALIFSDLSVSDLLAKIQHKILVSEADDLPCMRVDCDRLVRALDCLVEAVMRFNPDTGEVSVSAQRFDRELVLRVGGVQSKLPQIVKETCIQGYAFIETGMTSASSGLRLALSRAIIQAHKGSLTVKETKGSDAFELRLPIPA